jgi:hypothetical protein
VINGNGANGDKQNLKDAPDQSHQIKKEEKGLQRVEDVV